MHEDLHVCSLARLFRREMGIPARLSARFHLLTIIIDRPHSSPCSEKRAAGAHTPLCERPGRRLLAHILMMACQPTITMKEDLFSDPYTIDDSSMSRPLLYSIYNARWLQKSPMTYYLHAEHNCARDRSRDGWHGTLVKRPLMLYYGRHY